jgi:two-component system, cell cycle response regulator DivK
MSNLILIAEDDDTSFMYLDLILRKKNYDVLRAMSGDEALNLLEKHNNIALVLMDIKMPGLDGYEATRLIKKMYPEIPVIVQTAYALMGDRERSLEAGCDEYISKPVNREELISLVGKWLA